MFADIGPFFPDFSDGVVEELLYPNHPPPLLMESSFISEYDMGGGGGDFFSPPVPIFDKPVICLDPAPVLDPLEAFCDPDSVTLGCFESLQIDEPFDNASYRCQIDILLSFSTEATLAPISVVPISANTMAPDFSTDRDIKWTGANGCTCHGCEDRQQKLSRYRIKKSKRNFGRKIKYACRKVLADTQPRIRGRFAKMGPKGNEPNKRIHMRGW